MTTTLLTGPKLFLLWTLPLLWSAPAFATEPRPIELAIPLVQSAAAADQQLAGARAAGTGYLIDLSQTNAGGIFQAQPACALPPGRYRLHLLVGASPVGTHIVDPIELRLEVGGQKRIILPREIARTGELAAVTMDFAVTNDQPTAISAWWYVGDSLLDVPLQEKFTALQKLLKKRAAEIEKLKPPADPTGDVFVLDLPAPVAGGTTDRAEKVPAAVLVAVNSKTPKYRLAIAGVHVEALCPVGIEHVQTDQAAYEPDAKVQLAVTLRNFSRAAVQVELAAGLTPDDKPVPGLTGQRLTATVTIPAGGTVTNTFAETLATHGFGALTRIPVRVSWKDSRPAVATTLVGMVPAKKESSPQPKQVFAHYMGCWPAGTGSLWYERNVAQPKSLRHTSPDPATKFGGHVRNFDLVPPGKPLTPEQSADLEIRRAMRIGIDGFAIDAWAGGATARATVDALFKVAEEKNYPFQITLCLDPMCGGDLVGSVKELLAKHGTSPKLARRDGKPLIFGYQSWCFSMGWLWSQTDPDLSKDGKKAQVDQLRVSPAGWELMGQAFPAAADQIGQPIFWHYCLDAFFFNVNPAVMNKTAPSLVQAAAVIAKYVGAVGGFVSLGKDQTNVAKAVKAAGAEWSQPVGMYQKENIPYECYGPKGTEWLGCWDGARATDATLLQIVTWNDYGENTCIAPAWNTRYTLFELTGYYLRWWKTGRQPVPDHDQVYLNYHKYPRGSKIFPFKANFGPRDYALEVVTILPAPATIRLPGRAIEYEAPAGFYRYQGPLTTGPVIAELIRAGKTVLRLESPEPITDRPFREDNGLVCFSTEDTRDWQTDFGDVAPWWYSEYSEQGGTGLPNWFGMYWYGKWLDFATVTNAQPAADPHETGKTNLQHYRDQTDPTLAHAPALQ